MGAFSVKNLLKSVSLPFAPALLRNIEDEEKKMAEAQAAGQQYMPQLDQNAVQQANLAIAPEQAEAAEALMGAGGATFSVADTIE
jgi:hypothetical protein